MAEPERSQLHVKVGHKHIVTAGAEANWHRLVTSRKTIATGVRTWDGDLRSWPDPSEHLSGGKHTKSSPRVMREVSASAGPQRQVRARVWLGRSASVVTMSKGLSIPTVMASGGHGRLLLIVLRDEWVPHGDCAENLIPRPADRRVSASAIILIAVHTSETGE